jgi:hypothetical protein
MVGKGLVASAFTHMFLAQVYAMNAARAPEGEDRVKFGLTRMEAVKMGWLGHSNEVVVLPPIPQAMEKFLAEVKSEQIETARRAAFLLPMAAEHTVRTMGHHYLSTQSADYEERYRKTLSACLAPEIANWMRPSSLYHACLHWISPGRAREVIEAQKETAAIP